MSTPVLVLQLSLRSWPVILLWLVQASLLPGSVWGNVSVNLKSKVLTDILGARSSSDQKERPPHRSPDVTTAASSSSSLPHGKGKGGGRDGVSDILQLDLSGRLHVHVWGIPQEEAAARTSSSPIRPLLPWTTRMPASSSSRSPPPVSIKVGLDYDFANRQQQQHRGGWYGVQRVLASLAWQTPPPSRLQRPGRRTIVPSRHSDAAAAAAAEIVPTTTTLTTTNTHLKDIAANFQPRRVEFTVERGIQTVGDNTDSSSLYAGHVKIGWHDPTSTAASTASRLPFVKMGVDCMPNNNNQDKDSLDVVGAMTCSIPLHRRLLWRGKISRPLSCTLFPTLDHQDIAENDDNDESIYNAGSRRTRRSGGRRSISMPDLSDWNDVSSWLIPDVTVNALGQMQSNMQACLPLPPYRHQPQQQQERHYNEEDDNMNGRLGIRLSIRRQFDWDYPMLLSGLFGSSSSSSSGSNGDDDSSRTTICLEIKGMTPRTITAARFETSLEEPLEMAHLSILQYLGM